MITLAIETSCDETAVCVLETREESAKRGDSPERNNPPELEYRILANLIHSQIDLHKQYGGVFPIMAKREHARILVPLIEMALKEVEAKTGAEAKINSDTDSAEKIIAITTLLAKKESDLLEHLLASSLVKKKPVFTIDRIAVTRGPGLEPALWVGVNMAMALGILWDIPVVGVNHMEGHILGSLLPSSVVWDGRDASDSDFKKFIPVTCPAVALLISGGHTELVLVKDTDGREKNGHSDCTNRAQYMYEIIGRTKDDAVGEAFDKTARMLGLPYPGGPEISRLAEIERKKFSPEKIVLPRPMIHSPDLDFSFSGLKTAVLYLIREIKKTTPRGKGNEKNSLKSGEETDTSDISDSQKSEIAREFEDAVTDVLVSKTEQAIERYAVESLIVGGGVIANKHITQSLTQLAKKHAIQIYLPPTGVSGDNALMIAVAAYAVATNHGKNRTTENKTGVANPPPVNPPTNPLRAEGNLSF